MLFISFLAPLVLYFITAAMIAPIILSFLTPMTFADMGQVDPADQKPTIPIGVLIVTALVCIPPHAAMFADHLVEFARRYDGNGDFSGAQLVTAVVAVVVANPFYGIFAVLLPRLNPSKKAKCVWSSVLIGVLTLGSFFLSVSEMRANEQWGIIRILTSSHPATTISTSLLRNMDPSGWRSRRYDQHL